MLKLLELNEQVCGRLQRAFTSRNVEKPFDYGALLKGIGLYYQVSNRRDNQGLREEETKNCCESHPGWYILAAKYFMGGM